MTELENARRGAYDKVDLNALAGEVRDKIENYITTCKEAIKKGSPEEVTTKGAADNVVELTFALNCFFAKFGVNGLGIPMHVSAMEIVSDILLGHLGNERKGAEMCAKAYTAILAPRFSSVAVKMPKKKGEGLWKK